MVPSGIGSKWVNHIRCVNNSGSQAPPISSLVVESSRNHDVWLVVNHHQKWPRYKIVPFLIQKRSFGRFIHCSWQKIPEYIEFLFKSKKSPGLFTKRPKKKKTPGCISYLADEQTDNVAPPQVLGSDRSDRGRKLWWILGFWNETSIKTWSSQIV